MILVIKTHFLTLDFYMVKICVSAFLTVFQNCCKLHHKSFFPNTEKSIFFIEIQKNFMMSFCECLQKLQFYHVNFWETKNKKFINTSIFINNFIWWNLWVWFSLCCKQKSYRVQLMQKCKSFNDLVRLLILKLQNLCVQWNTLRRSTTWNCITFVWALAGTWIRICLTFSQFAHLNLLIVSKSLTKRPMIF